MTWAPNEDWVDANIWVLNADGEGGEGSWGMVRDDYERENIHGWEVRKRPRPVLL